MVELLDRTELRKTIDELSNEELGKLGLSRRREVVVTGMGCISPIGNSIETFTENLFQGNSGIVQAPDDDFWFDLFHQKSCGLKLTGVDEDRIRELYESFRPEEFNCRYVGYPQNFDLEDFFDPETVKDFKFRGTKDMDLCTQYALAAAEQAVRDSGFDTSEFNPRFGVIVGTGIGGTRTHTIEHTILLEKGIRRVSTFTIPTIIPNLVAGELGIFYNAGGPNEVVITACSSSTHGGGNALNMIRYGLADIILLVGTENIWDPLCSAGFESARAYYRGDLPAQEASRPFDRDRNGFVPGVGAGALIFESLEHALARNAKIYAKVLGYGTSCDAYHRTAPHPTGEGAYLAIKHSLEDALIEPEQIVIDIPHATSTGLNDPIETYALKRALGKHAYNLVVSGTKSMTGHMIGAAGAIELIALIQSLRRQEAPPTINLNNPDIYEEREEIANLKKKNPDLDLRCDLNYAANQAVPINGNVGMSLSLGFGGQNANLVVERYKT